MGTNKRFSQTRGQVGVEYMIIVGFVTLAIITVVVLAYFYSANIKDMIRLNQVEGFASRLISSAESVFFKGEPSKATIKLYLPDGVDDITVTQGGLIISTRVSSGINRRLFPSEVPLNGSITTPEGLKKLVLEARVDDVLISQAS
jgi:uncharacterized protein (UPF0333 family)